MLKNLFSIRHFRLSKSFLVHSTTRNAPYFLPHFDRLEIRSVFSNALRLDLALQNRFTIHSYPPEKKTHTHVLKCRSCFRFSTLLLFIYDCFTKQNPHKIQFLLILLARLAFQSANATILKNLIILLKRCFHI